MKAQFEKGLLHINANPKLTDIDQVKALATLLNNDYGFNVPFECDEEGEFYITLDGMGMTIAEMKAEYAAAKKELTTVDVVTPEAVAADCPIIDGLSENVADMVAMVGEQTQIDTAKCKVLTGSHPLDKNNENAVIGSHVDGSKSIGGDRQNSNLCKKLCGCIKQALIQQDPDSHFVSVSGVFGFIKEKTYSPDVDYGNYTPRELIQTLWCDSDHKFPIYGGARAAKNLPLCHRTLIQHGFCYVDGGYFCLDDGLIAMLGCIKIRQKYVSAMNAYHKMLDVL